jgi:hypothetical protein
MYFKNGQELLEFMNTIDLDKSTLIFKESAKKPCACEGKSKCQCPPKKDDTVAESMVKVSDAATKIIVESFVESEEFDLVTSETVDENILYVNDYEAIENACGTGRLQIGETTTFMNMCEMDNKATVHLDIVVEGKQRTNVPFTLLKTSVAPYLVLSK